MLQTASEGHFTEIVTSRFVLFFNTEFIHLTTVHCLCLLRGSKVCFDLILLDLGNFRLCDI